MTSAPTSAAAAYTWQKDSGLSLDLGGGSSSTLSALIAPGTSGDWLIAGSQFTSGGPSYATVWRSADGISWAKSRLAVPAGTISGQADGATNWGSHQVVVGSIDNGSTTSAAVWISGGAGQPFTPVPVTSPGPLSATTEASTTTTSSTTTTTAPGATLAQNGAVMDNVAANNLGLLAAGTVDGRAALWYSSDGQSWSLLNGADKVVNQSSGAVIDDLLAIPSGVFAGGYATYGDRWAAELWYTSDGIHWTAVRSPGSTFAGAGDHIITSLVDIGETGTGTPGTPGPTGLLAVGGIRGGATWSPASWISPNGFSWSQTSQSFTLDHEPADSPGALAYAASGADGGLYAVGGSPGRQRLWVSNGGLAWSEVPLPAAAANDPDWHLGLVASDSHTTVVADNLPGQPYVLVKGPNGWSQPSANGVFGAPLATALPTSLLDVEADGMLVMSVQVSHPGLRLGTGTTTVAVLASNDGLKWQTENVDAFSNATVNDLLAVPNGLVAVGSAPLAGGSAGTGRGDAGAFASLSTDMGATWAHELISPAGLGSVNSATAAVPTTVATSTTSVTSTTMPASTTISTTPGPTVSSASSVTGPTIPGSTSPGPTSPASTSATTTSAPAATTTLPVTTTTTPLPVPLTGPYSAEGAGPLGEGEYVVGNAGPVGIAWYSLDGANWQVPRPLDPAPEIGDEEVLGTCWAGNSAVAVGSISTPRHGALPAAWVSTDGSSWTASVFLPAPPAASSTSLYGCLSTGNGFIAYGQSTGTGEAEAPVLWSSGDGTTWQQLSTTFTGTDGAAPTGVQTAPLDDIAFGTTTWLGVSGTGDLPNQVWPAPVGGTTGLQTTPAGLWASDTDGNSWQQLGTDGPPFEAASYVQADHAVYVGQQPIVAGTVDGQLTVWVGTETSDGGS